MSVVGIRLGPLLGGKKLGNAATNRLFHRSNLALDGARETDIAKTTLQEIREEATTNSFL